MPVPVTVWKPSRPATGHRQEIFNAAVAARLICTYTRPGQLVAGLAHPGAIAEAAAWLARRATVIVTDRNHHEELSGVLEPRLNPVRRNIVRVVYSTTGHAELLSRSRRQVSLIITRMEAEQSATPGSDLHRILAGCAAALTRDGILAIEVPSIDASGRFADHITDIITLARSEGLIYHEHLIAIGDRLYPASGYPSTSRSPDSTPVDPVRREHIDLLILSNSGAIYA